MLFSSPIEKTAAILRNDMPSQTRVCAFKVAALIFQRAEGADDSLRHAFTKMASADPGPAANPIATAIHSALGKGAAAGHLKEASAILSKLVGAKDMIAGGASNAADLIKIVAGTGALAGVVGGAGGFALKRGLESEDDRLLKLENEKVIMQRLANDIQKELSMRGLAATPKNTAAVVDYLT